MSPQLAVDAVSSPLTRALYLRALQDFFASSPTLSRAAVQTHRAALEAAGYSASSINLRLAAIRKLARESALNGLLDASIAAAILAIPGVPAPRHRTGRWLTLAQTRDLLHAPDPSTLKGKRDRALLALLAGCGLRRGEAVSLTREHIEQRDGRWAAIDLAGKHGRLRTVPIPAWVKQALDLWTEAAALGPGPLLRPVDRHGRITGASLSPQAVLDAVAHYARPLGLAPLRPHDLRRTCARLCRSAGGDLEQIQLLLGHASIQTTERYLGTRQDLARAPNDRLQIRWDA